MCDLLSVDEELAKLWEDKLNTPEGVAACVYALTLTVGQLLVKLENPSLDYIVEGETLHFLRSLRERVRDADGDLTFFDDVWERFLEIANYQDPTMWDHLMDAD